MSEIGCLIGFPNRVDAGSLTGGSFVSSLPLSNLQNKLLGRVARTTNALEASTNFTVDLNNSQATKIISLVNHNISLDGTWRIRSADEVSTTNYLLYTEDFSGWINVGIQGSTDNKIAPNGAASAKKYIPNTLNSQHKITRVAASPRPAGRYTLSLFVKADGYSRVMLSQPTTDIATASFDLISGGVWVTAGVGATASMSDIGDGWKRVTLSYTTNSTYTPSLSILILDTATGADTFIANGVSGLQIWGCQLETGPNVTSYYPSTSVVGVRPTGYLDAWQIYGYDSGTLPVWSEVYASNELEWEDDSFWSGTYTPEEISGYTPTVVHILPEIVLAKTWRIDILDSGNPAGYVQIGRVFIGPAWAPINDAEVGLTIGWESATTTQSALSGTRYYQRRTPYRVTSFTLNVMSVDEAMQKAFELDRMAGIDQEVFWVQQQNDTVHALRRRFLSTIRQMTPVEFPFAHLGKKSYVLEEVV